MQTASKHGIAIKEEQEHVVTSLHWPLMFRGHPRRVDSSTLFFSLSSHWHSFIGFVFTFHCVVKCVSMTQVSSREKWREVEEEKCMCGCKRIRTVRISMRIGGDQMFSEASAERFVCRSRTSPFCPSEYVKMVCRGAPRETRNSDFDGVCSCLWCVRKEAYMSLLPCMRRHRSWMTTKSPNLNISGS